MNGFHDPRPLHSVPQHLFHSLDNLRGLSHHFLGEPFHIIAADRIQFIASFFGLCLQLGILEGACKRVAKNLEAVGPVCLRVPPWNARKTPPARITVATRRACSGVLY